MMHHLESNPLSPVLGKRANIPDARYLTSYDNGGCAHGHLVSAGDIVAHKGHVERPIGQDYFHLLRRHCKDLEQD